MAIEEWTSEGMNWESLTNKLLYPYMEALRLALVERCNGTFYNVPSVLSVEIASNIIPSSEWMDAFKSTITTLFILYANHTDNSGAWNGLSNIPSWTEETMLEAIEDSERIETKLPLASWAIQQYKILNMLKYARLDYQNNYEHTLATSGCWTIWRKLISIAESYSDAVDDYNNTDPIIYVGSTDGAMGYGVYGRVFSEYQVSTNYYSLYRNRTKQSINKSGVIESAPYNCDIDWYEPIIRWSSTGYNYFDDNGAGVIENTYKRADYASFVKDDDLKTDNYFPSSDAPPDDCPSPPSGYNLATNGFSYAQDDDFPQIAIIKYDNGFQFKNW